MRAWIMWRVIMPPEWQCRKCGQPPRACLPVPVMNVPARSAQSHKAMRLRVRLKFSAGNMMKPHERLLVILASHPLSLLIAH